MFDLPTFGWLLGATLLLSALEYGLLFYFGRKGWKRWRARRRGAATPDTPAARASALRATSGDEP